MLRRSAVEADIKRRFLALGLAAALGGCAATASDQGFGGNSGATSSPSGGQGGTTTGTPDAGGGPGGFGTTDAGSMLQEGGGDGGPVDLTPPCDTGIPIDDADPASFAKAMGICTTVAVQGFGLVSASYSKAFGSSTAPHAGQWGMLPSFGTHITPREGRALGVLSTGYAREYDDAQGIPIAGQATTCGSAPAVACCWSGIAGSCPVGVASDFVNSSPDGPLEGTNYPTGAAPPGFPQSSQGCKQDDVVNDMIDLKLVLKAPMDATGFQFDFDFYSSEWPNFVCSTFNDAFVAYLTSSAITNNISFDPNNDPISVNNDFLNRCTPGAPLGCNRTDGQTPDAPYATSTCAGGTSELEGTGYANTAQTLCNGGNVAATLGGATGWLTTQAPIHPGEQFTLELMIWDAGDGILDSSVLLDHFQWLGVSTPSPVTQPVTQ
jgi:hypothetical protein